MIEVATLGKRLVGVNRDGLLHEYVGDEWIRVVQVRPAKWDAKYAMRPRRDTYLEFAAQHEEAAETAHDSQARDSLLSVAKSWALLAMMDQKA